MGQGTISLHAKTGEMVSQLKYHKKYVRNTIVESWKKNYGEKYKECFLQIAPNANERMVNIDGTNIKTNTSKKLK